jgi:hypothetical protein
MKLSWLLCYCAVVDTVLVVSVLSWKTVLNITHVFLRTAGCTVNTATSLVTFKPKPQPET